jgi:hypothetical protein
MTIAFKANPRHQRVSWFMGFNLNYSPGAGRREQSLRLLENPRGFKACG